VKMAVNAKPGDFANWRTASFRSLNMMEGSTRVFG
jgi:hypothetical protein